MPRARDKYSQSQQQLIDRGLRPAVQLGYDRELNIEPDDRSELQQFALFSRQLQQPVGNQHLDAIRNTP